MILVTGGAGYIGSFTAKRLLDNGNQVLIVDNLKRGHKENLDPRATFIEGDLTDLKFVEQLFKNHQFEAVFHFGGLIAVGESMQDPGSHFINNSLSALNILEQLKNQEQKKFIFSSTAAVYGNPQKTPISENQPLDPTNTYGESKLMVEKVLKWYQQIYSISFVALRYFNAAGATLDGSMGEDHIPETHIIPNAIKAGLNNQIFKLFGDDYQTEDGTCVRDYIHVLDLVEAHLLAWQQINQQPGGYIYNVGTGQGYSNKQVLDLVQKVMAKELKISVEPRRPGDPDKLIADSSKIKQDLGFSPKYSDLETIIETAVKWHKNK